MENQTGNRSYNARNDVRFFVNINEKETTSLFFCVSVSSSCGAYKRDKEMNDIASVTRPDLISSEQMKDGRRLAGQRLPVAPLWHGPALGVLR